MSLSHDDVRKIALLARLAVNDADVDAYARNLSSILAFVEQMEAVATDHVTPMAHPQDTAQRMRDDAVTEADQHEKFQAIAPAVEAGLYLVPRVIE
ncbi:asparaginyl/glutamyl-tRNA amidotransferase subunit C [Thioalkalivibrio denitrificans]|uniref:Aspartyl/glutamyl-tRNA(Asn/Gln) amidotransferase subunit C n=1 Tax=Thioalkalivibrio denitrificans TaxID=108003 RepID=A0A1V3NCV3_9GAMM|nr:Asp-tRNA(Asn)/Glu-tRNA(Gln) amidotransferase subunit GatC [Thioalkalivibrio denitrificans]OOG22927.1 asparaginyl/glutamyl-tRNA amidotransferase subunit C [Thioalkalivibrio denitrificans]